MAEWFFDDHVRPVVVFFLGEAAIAQHLGDRRKESRGDRQIEESVSERVVELVSLVNLLLQALVSFGVLKIAADVVDALGDFAPELRVEWGWSILGNLFRQHLAKTLGGVVVGCESHDGELLRKKFVLSEIADRGKQFAFGEVAGGAENNHYTRRRSGVHVQMV